MVEVLVSVVVWGVVEVTAVRVLVSVAVAGKVVSVVPVLLTKVVVTVDVAVLVAVVVVLGSTCKSIQTPSPEVVP